MASPIIVLEVRTALAIAGALGRILIMPELWCGAGKAIRLAHMLNQCCLPGFLLSRGMCFAAPKKREGGAE